ncbi:coatomer subunit beta-like [Cottoperca gobio]|uniref:Coatomer subunit beta-like n=1 Tax=Cottoperca gobio TaxID=56716 RepID=A0A6J2P6T1_COTGO|nr:coatomer subunit beta-like [Cottoperca gobio]
MNYSYYRFQSRTSQVLARQKPRRSLSNISLSQVTVNTNITDLNEYLQHILKSTNMKCLTPEKALSGFCGFMAANLYARSIFGEDALANVSIEKPIHLGPDAPVNGHIRIRAKSQGMALSLGDKINLSQKKSNV